MINRKEVIKELSWWDLHKDKVYLSIISVVIGLIIWIKLKIK